MSMTDNELSQYYKALNLINENLNLFAPSKPCDESWITNAKSTLQLQFPEMYRDFVNKFSQPLFGGTMFYGIFYDDYTNTTSEDAVIATRDARQYDKMPDNFLYIANSGFTHYDYYIDCSVTGSGSKPVFVYYYARDPEFALTEKIAESFGEYLLDAVIEEIKFNDEWTNSKQAE